MTYQTHPLEERSRTYFSRYYGGKNASAQYRPVARAIDEEALKIGDEAIAAMVEIMAPHLDDVVFGKRLLPEEVYGKGYTTIFKNGSYGRSMENTTNCVRTLAYNEFTDEVKKQIGRPLTTAESFLASQMLYDIAKDPQCLYCYVSLDRKAYDEFLLRYMQERDVMLKQYAEMEDKSPEAMEALYNTYLNGRKDTKPMRERFNKLISIVDNGGTLISGYELMTREKRNEMRETSEDMRWQIEDAEKYAQGASWAKKEEEYRAYAGEILKMPFSIVKQLSEEYGLRFYSFSEYTPAFIVENMQMVRDAALRGLRGFAYTKEVDFVKIFAPTGMNMNVSTFGRVDSEGNVVPDERQGASWEEVKALREQYPNVGATFVATDDAMVEWALAQDWVDVVIPFHIVRTGADVAEFYKWTNYSSQQSDIKDGRKADIMPTEHHNNLETYLALCDERGITPRFSQWRENPNYMKLVNETRRSVDETPILQPTFNLEAAKESWNNFVEKGGYYGGWYEVDEQGFNEAVEQVASDIEAGKSARDVDYGRQDIPADYAERARKARVNKSHGNTPKLSIKEMDAPYLEAVERGDMETAQRMVDEAARLAGYTEQVYHGTPKFGFTTFLSRRPSGAIFTTSQRSVSANYGGDGGASVRRINKGYRDPQTVEDIIDNAQSVLGYGWEDARLATEEDKARIIESVESTSKKVVSEMEALKEAAGEMPEAIKEDVAWVENIIYDGAQLRENGNEGNEASEMVRRDFEMYRDARQILREYDGNLPKAQKEYLSFLTGSRLGDVAIDIGYSYASALSEKPSVYNRGSLTIAEDVDALSKEWFGGNGSYALYGDLGNNPLEIDADGKVWYAMDYEGMRDTDAIAEWAKENGYTSVVFKNIYDYGDKSDVKVFFSSNQICRPRNLR